MKVVKTENGCYAIACDEGVSKNRYPSRALATRMAELVSKRTGLPLDPPERDLAIG